MAVKRKIVRWRLREVAEFQWIKGFSECIVKENIITCGCAVQCVISGPLLVDICWWSQCWLKGFTFAVKLFSWLWLFLDYKFSGFSGFVVLCTTAVAGTEMIHYNYRLLTCYAPFLSLAGKFHFVAVENCLHRVPWCLVWMPRFYQSLHL